MKRIIIPMDNLQIFRKMAGFPYNKEHDITILATKKDYFDNTKHIVFKAGSQIKVLEISEKITSKRNISYGEFMKKSRVSEADMLSFNEEYGIEIPYNFSFDELRFGVRILKDLFSTEFVKNIVEKKLLLRALISDYYTVKSAEKIGDGKILKVTYDNDEEEIFISELPIFSADVFTPEFANKLSKATNPKTAYMIIFNYRYHLKDRNGLIKDYMDKVPKQRQTMSMIRTLQTESFEKLCLERLKNNPHIDDYKIFKMENRDFVFYKMSAVRYF